MSIFTKVKNLFDRKYEIQYTDKTRILTKHGMFEARMYRQNFQEYLVISSINLNISQNPIFYIHVDEHECDALDHFCDCSYPIGVALDMINKSGGFILYSNQDVREVDKLLDAINTKKLQLNNKIKRAKNIKSALKGYRGEYLTIDFILQDLELTSVQLVSKNQNIIYILEQRGIVISNQTSSLSFTYGDNQVKNRSETEKLLDSLSFEYKQ